MYEDVIWDSVKYEIFCTKDEFLENLKQYEVFALHRDGVLAGLWMTKGAEFHIYPMGGSYTMADIRNVIQPLIDRYGYATTKTPLSDKRQQRFNRRLGFVQIGEDDVYVTYKIESLP